MIVFVDESGLKAPCNCVALGAVYFRRGGNYLEAGAHLAEALRRLAGIGGELRWRRLKMRGKGEAALELIRLSAADVRWIALHYTPQGLVEALNRLVEGTELAVLDNQLAPKGIRLAARHIERDSRRVPGIQLADVVAGWAHDLLCRPRQS